MTITGHHFLYKAEWLCPSTFSSVKKVLYYFPEVRKHSEINKSDKIILLLSGKDKN
jgi:hypothetical protein